MKSCKILLCGAGGCGKTTFLKCYLGGVFEEKYLPTIGVDVLPVKMGNDTLLVWDLAGQEVYNSQREEYFIGANAAIVMLDLSTSVDSIKFNILHWLQDINRVCPNIPIIIALSKPDLSKHAIPELTANLKEKTGLPVIVVHTKKDHTHEPFKLAAALIKTRAKC